MLIGIDLSLNSTAVTKLDGNTVQFFSIARHEKPEKWLKTELIKKLQEENLVEFRMVEKKKSKEYSESEIIKASMNIQVVDHFLKLISKGDEVAMEGLAYGAKGNSLLDIAQLTGCVRSSFVRVCDDKAKILAPSELKRFATGNGNANKMMMLNAFLEKSNTKLAEFIEKNKGLCISKKDEIQKPLDDLVDSWWAAKYLLDVK